MICESPRLLTGEMMAARIFSPFAYPLVRNTRQVPIVVCEAERLGVAFPVVWHIGTDGPELCVLRTLMEDGTGYLPGVDTSLGLLPLLFQGYPLLFPPGPIGETGNRRMIDAVVADRPTDVGASITNIDGRLSRGTEMRLHALDIFERDYRLTADIGRRIAEMELFEPWPLDFDLGFGRRCRIDDLFVFSQKAFDSPRVAPLLAEFGPVVARLLGLHRLSLFRAGVLLGSARTAVAAAAARLREERV